MSAATSGGCGGQKAEAGNNKLSYNHMNNTINNKYYITYYSLVMFNVEYCARFIILEVYNVRKYQQKV